MTETKGAVRVERLPAYAPDLNPVEWLWRHLKEVELRNLTCLDLDQLYLEFHLALGRLRQKPRLAPRSSRGLGYQSKGLVLSATLSKNPDFREMTEFFAPRYAAHSGRRQGKVRRAARQTMG